MTLADSPFRCAGTFRHAMAATLCPRGTIKRDTALVVPRGKSTSAILLARVAELSMGMGDHAGSLLAPSVAAPARRLMAALAVVDDVYADAHAAAPA